jgi:glycosyltransferase involved in cell wall biosynthesis
MRIAIDARFLTHPQPGGFKTYTTNLVNALGQIDEENEYILYLDRIPTDETFPQGKNFSWQVVPGTLPGLGMPLREQIILRQRIRADKVDLIHFLCNTATVNIPQKYIVTLHDTIQVTDTASFLSLGNLGAYKRWTIMAYSKWTILKTVHCADRIVTVSNHEKIKIVQQLKVAPEHIAVTHLAPNGLFSPVTLLQRETWRKELRQRIRLPCKFILGIGYEPRKNIPLLIKAFAQIANEYPTLGLVIVAAAAEQRVAFQSIANELGLAERAIVLGALSAHELAMLYNLAEVFVFPSERESFGLPPLEAMACGVPTLAMNMSSIPEIVQDGALLIDGKNVGIWADALRRIIGDQRLRSSLIEHGLQRAAQLNWQKCAQATIQIYQDVFTGCKPSDKPLL